MAKRELLKWRKVKNGWRAGPFRVYQSGSNWLCWCSDGCFDVLFSGKMDAAKAACERLARRIIAATRTDLPTILTRLANERAKLVIAMEALESACLAIRQGAAQETRNITEDALARITELEKQHGKT